MKYFAQWRTVIAVEILGVNLLIGLWVVCRTEGLIAMAMGAIFAAFAAAIVGLGGFISGKSMVEHLANGTGVKGAVSALMTNAKPGDAENTEATK